MEITELKDFFQDGILTDLMYSIRHYFIWRTIGENYDQITKIENKYFVNFLGELQSNSHDLAIIRLSKIYDRQPKKYQIRSIYGLLDLELFSTVYFPIHTLNHDEFEQILKLVPTYKFPSVINTPLEFSKIFKELLIETQLKIIIDKLKFIRDKTIAHNEHNVTKYGFEANNFWNDYTKLLYFSQSFISLFGNVFLSSHYWQFSYKELNDINFSILADLYWVRQQIEDKIGKINFVQWWNKNDLN